jgi:AcrR family transcriptional regulator
MARPIPLERFDQLIRTAAEVFIRNGYRRTQMADVAEALGVAKGTVYLYVESKEALFDVVARHIDDPGPIPCPTTLPVKTPSTAATLRAIRERIGARSRIAPLERALADSANDVSGGRQELEAIALAVYDVLYSNRRGMKLIDRSSVDRPDFAALWFQGAREGLMAALVAYLRKRIGDGTLRDVPDVETAARAVIEVLAFWAVHRHWDARPQATTEEHARATAVELVVRMFAREK